MDKVNIYSAIALYFLLCAPAFGAEAPRPNAGQLPDVVNGTGSSDIFHHEDSEAEVWGVHPTPKQDQNLPDPPIFVEPEITWRQHGRPQRPDNKPEKWGLEKYVQEPKTLWDDERGRRFPGGPGPNRGGGL